MPEDFIINSLPLYWRVKKDINNEHSRIPSNYKFSISRSEKTGCITQNINNELKNILIDIYSENENIGYLRDDNKLAHRYHLDLLDYIKRFLKREEVKYILEIGCGGCTILKELSEIGYKVTGLDPSPFARDCANEKNINLIEDFFKPELIDKGYDLVFFSDVLEHIFEPIEFLNSLRETLKENSTVIIAVPDATSENMTGDYSMLMHQHISYFTEQTLFNTLIESGLEPVSIEKAGYGGSLYAIAKVKKDTPQNKHTDEDQKIRRNYFELAEKAKNNFQRLFSNAENRYSRVICYVPLRALPYLSSINKLGSEKIFFADDTQLWNNCYIDGTKKIIKPLQSFMPQKNDCVFIFSNTFGETIKSKVQKYYGNQTPYICTIKDIVEKA